MIMGIWANPNYDDDKGTRNRTLRQIDDWYREAVSSIYEPKKDPIDKDNPFFGKMKLPDDPGVPDPEDDDPRRILDIPDLDQDIYG